MHFLLPLIHACADGSEIPFSFLLIYPALSKSLIKILAGVPLTNSDSSMAFVKVSHVIITISFLKMVSKCLAFVLRKSAICLSFLCYNLGKLIKFGPQYPSENHYTAIPFIIQKGILLLFGSLLFRQTAQFIVTDAMMSKTIEYYSQKEATDLSERRTNTGSFGVNPMDLHHPRVILYCQSTNQVFVLAKIFPKI